MLMLAHFHIETHDAPQATILVERARAKAKPYELLMIFLTQAVVLWEIGEHEQALEQLQHAQRSDRTVPHTDDLRFDYFWRKRALNALAALREMI